MAVVESPRPAAAVAEPSDFGLGYATCLRQFANHRARLLGYIADWARYRESSPEFFSEEGAIEMWANGASDHLYELRRPRRGVPNVEWSAAQTLYRRAIDIGHGFRPSSRSDQAEAVGLLDEAERLLTALAERGLPTGTLDEAMATDRALGLAPERGTWSCLENLSRR
jgi:hypothetical protein